MTGLAPQEAATDRRAAEGLVERLLSAYGAHDVEALRVLYVKDAVIRIGELEFRGRDGVGEFWSGWFAAFPDASTRVERAFVEPRRIVLDWTERGTHRGPVRMGDLEIQPRGGSLCWRGVSIYELSGGQIVAVDYYVDRLRVAEQLMKPAAVTPATEE